MKKVLEIPTARIAVKKNVVKHYEASVNKQVFLKDGTEFDIELFNPLRTTVLAKISINGVCIPGQGLILRPGERVFLERYLHENRKFKFSTYLVEDSPEVNKAISDNGLVEVAFYAENAHYTYSAYYNDAGYTYTTGSSYTYCTNINSSHSDIELSPIIVKSDKKETGLVEKGSPSDQHFSEAYHSFHFIPFHTEIIKILPESEKTYTSEDIKYKRYCSECGSKVKYSDKYCSNCGHKL